MRKAPHCERKRNPKCTRDSSSVLYKTIENMLGFIFDLVSEKKGKERKETVRGVDM